MLLFCRKITLSDPGLLQSRGPLLLAVNHPNSFLDSVILNVLLKQPVWSLARGDVFKNKIITRILTSFKILPVYRTSEGVENLSENYKTFDACIELFRRNGIVTIYSEGKCVNEWHLRPLKKGTARLAVKAWEEKIPLKILPVGINYSSFYRFGKNMYIHFGQMISKKDIDFNGADGLRHSSFNKKLEEELKQLVYEIPGDDKAQQSTRLEVKPALWKKIFLAIPAAIGWLLHVPLYFPAKKIVLVRTKGTGHYDSVMTGVLIFAYPVYITLLLALLLLVCKSVWLWTLPLIMPFTAWAYVQLKPQLDK